MTTLCAVLRQARQGRVYRRESARLAIPDWPQVKWTATLYGKDLCISGYTMIHHRPHQLASLAGVLGRTETKRLIRRALAASVTS